eukprot:Nitzschia sp. Nitz4//scaffold85_size83877//48782//49303//NITZ4_005233-RA/size83877-processed-gene-0.123-mRNA-1//1//CDS//3329559149//1671//frame0
MVYPVLTKQKPNTTADMIVADVIFGEPGCSARWGWEMEIDDHFSPHLKKAMSAKEWDTFVEEANDAMLVSKLNGGGLLSNCCIFMTCCLPLICLRCSINSASEKALANLQGVIKKWNSILEEKGGHGTMRLQCYKKPLHTSQVRADGSVSATLDNAERLAECDYIAWIEIEVA